MLDDQTPKPDSQPPQSAPGAAVPNPAAADTGGADPGPDAPLLERYRAIKTAVPTIRARDAATRLGVSEGELVACRCGSDPQADDHVIRLSGDFEAILKRLPALGTIMALTRNDSAVHEKVGQFDHVSVNGSMGLVLNHHIDLRLFMNHWRFGFAVSEQTRSGLRRSLQVFDAAGEAVHKIYLREDSDAAAYDRLIAQYTDEDQSPGITVMPYPAKRPDPADESVDLAAFRAHWAGLQDTHDFFGMLQDFGIGRLQAMRLAGEAFAQPLSPTALRLMLETAAERDIPIMCFVGNRGCIQIHTGPVKELKEMGPWYNVLDPDFNLHLRQDRIASAWLVRKPTRDGTVTSVELFDAEGTCFAQFFGERKPKRPELDSWRALAEDLPRIDPALIGGGEA